MIIGNKTIIRPMEMEDVDFIHRWWNNEESLTYSGLRYGFMMSKTALENRFRTQIASAEVYPAEEKMFIMCKREDGTPIGDITYRNWDKRNRSAEIGLEICDPANRGKGYGRDAMTAFIDFMFRHLNLHRIELTTSETNETGQRLYHKLGFKTIGIARDHYYDSVKDCYTNTVYMDLLRSDWDKLK